MRRNGFTLIELLIVFAVMSITVPLAFEFCRTLEGLQRKAVATAQAGDAVRVVAEQLRLDLFTHRLGPGTEVTMEDSGCGIRYFVDGGVVFRGPIAASGCAPAQPLARGVGALVHVGNGVVELRTGGPSNAATHSVFLGGTP